MHRMLCGHFMDWRVLCVLVALVEWGLAQLSVGVAFPIVFATALRKLMPKFASIILEVDSD